MNQEATLIQKPGKSTNKLDHPSLKTRILTTSFAQPLRQAYYWLRRSMGWYDAQATIIKDNQSFWSEEANLVEGQYTHNRGVGIFKDDAKWFELGQESYDIYQMFLRGVDYKGPMEAMVDWGCGGGANAVHWAPGVRHFYALDIYQPTIDECMKQLDAENIHNGIPVLVDASNPEGAQAAIKHPLDLFFCVYVIEVLPSKEYVDRLMRLAHQMVRPGGLAFIQLKYADDRWQTQGRRWSYANNPCHMTTFRVDEFWVLAESCGWKAKLCTLLPKQPRVNDERYAYYLLQKPE